MGEITAGAQLEIKGLQKRFGNRLILDQLDLYIQPGEFLTIVGPSGCGKSTLLRLIAGLEASTDGEIIQDGHLIQGLNRRVRVMFQDSRLLPWRRVSENVALGMEKAVNRKERQKRTLQVLQEVGLSEYADEWPGVLSGGQRQRVALARALISQTHLLLLDEPLGALDALTRIGMQQLIERLWLEQKFTSLLVTHDVEEAVILADRVILLENGRVGMDVPVSLPRPRQRSSAQTAALIGKIQDRVMNVTQVKPKLNCQLPPAMMRKDWA